MSGYQFVGWVSFLFLCGSYAGAQDKTEKSTVSVTVLNQEGELVPGDSHVHVDGKGLHQDERIQTRGSFELPYGDYTVGCWGGNAVSPEWRIAVYLPKTEIVCTLLPRMPGDGITIPWEVKGVVDPMPSKGVVVARLISLYSRSGEETIVAPDGSFTLYVRSMSPYKLWILSGGKRVAERDITIGYLSPKDAAPIRVNLSQVAGR